MKRTFFLLNCLLLFMVSVAQKPHVPFVNLHPELPKVEKGDVVISHEGYSFLYKEEYEQSSWVAYELTKEETAKAYERTNKFMPDPAVSTLTANNADYAGSGYDKGHLAPAADMGWSATAMAESFYFSNMSPQVPGFNRGIWKKLEELVRSWAIENNSILIVTGPVLKEGLKTIGADRVSVPEEYYKVILDNHEPEIKGIAFLIPNASQSAGLQSFVVSIDSVESVTGIDFFPGFPNEAAIEKTSSVEQWSWTRTTEQVTASNQGFKDPVHSTINQKQSPAQLKQCHGVTKSGGRCRNKTTNANGYCHLHQSQAKGQ
ncbi:MAG TPA: DNA/RNA non-specific endonuclease [Prolixibacteraceae bacterium]|jgi:endonuclease G|nr:DNA/RNA non-specific endonuclease [Prolixibacteraceae bacterium]